MRLIFALAVAFLCAAQPSAWAEVVDGNPDQRPSFYLGYRLGWGNYSIWQTGGGSEPLYEISRDFQHLIGELTMPATKNVSFVASGGFDVSGSVRDFSSQDYSTQSLDVLEVGIRLFLP